MLPFAIDDRLNSRHHINHTRYVFSPSNEDRCQQVHLLGHDKRTGTPSSAKPLLPPQTVYSFGRTWLLEPGNVRDNGAGHTALDP